jgi:DNA-binding response OmpR family regulator
VPSFSPGFLEESEAIMSAQLTGCLVLVVEDEALIGMDIAAAFREAGAEVLLARTLKQALAHAEHDPLTCAVIDHSLHDGVTTSDVCAALEKRHIPFIVYSGFDHIEGVCAKGELVHKPASPAFLVTTMKGALDEHRRQIN